MDTVNTHAPLKTHRIKKDTQPDWLTSDILDKMKERDKLKRQGKEDEYKIIRNNVPTLIQESKTETYKSKLRLEKMIQSRFGKYFESLAYQLKRKYQS